MDRGPFYSGLNGQGAILLCTKNLNGEKKFIIHFLFGFVVRFVLK
jgi:hypothetical protein